VCITGIEVLPMLEDFSTLLRLLTLGDRQPIPTT
jgi:hypothetical protein